MKRKILIFVISILIIISSIIVPVSGTENQYRDYATPLISGQFITDKLNNAKDQKWYKFDVISERFISFEFIHEIEERENDLDGSNDFWEIYIYDETGDYLILTYDFLPLVVSGKENLDMDQIEFEKGTYYLKVNCRKQNSLLANWTDKSYEIRFIESHEHYYGEVLEVKENTHIVKCVNCDLIVEREHKPSSTNVRTNGNSSLGFIVTTWIYGDCIICDANIASKTVGFNIYTYPEYKEYDSIYHYYRYGGEFELKKHNYANISFDDTLHTITCACGEQKKEVHRFGPEYILKAPTDYEEGIRVQKCVVCDYYYETTIRQNIIIDDGEKYTNWSNPTLYLIYIVLTIVYLLIAYVIVLIEKKRTDNITVVEKGKKPEVTPKVIETIEEQESRNDEFEK